MAAAFAQHLLKDRVHSRSAGINPVYDRATDEAIRVMSERGIDISDHRSRSVQEVDLDEFDCVVALTPSIRKMLPPVKRPERIVTWNIADPYGGDLAEHRACATEIERELKVFLESLDTGTVD
jgi:protein-tyrosine-phosphatase